MPSTAQEQLKQVAEEREPEQEKPEPEESGQSQLPHQLKNSLDW
jgi:hypothetical protein